MRSAVLIGLLAAALAGCAREPTPEEQALADARDVEFVKDAQNGLTALAQLSPERITPADLEQNGLPQPRCSFAEAAGKAPVLMIMADTIYLKQKGDLQVFAADKGTPQLPYGGWTRYAGREYTIDLQTIGERNISAKPDVSIWPGRLTVRDEADRVVYSRMGEVRCGA